jgi:serine phosphatase RsbU (regulator of sigma subunit)
MVLTRMGETFNFCGDPDAAIETCNTALDIARKNEFISGEKAIHTILSRIYEKKGEIDKAYFHLRSHTDLEANLKISRQTQQIGKMELSFVEETKNKEIGLLNLVKEKHREISESLSYAKGIQKAILHDPHLFNKTELDHFVFFQPKEQVGGDFYWFRKTDHSYVYCVADCTGHGVPGAMLSMLCSNFIKQHFNSKAESSMGDCLAAITKELHRTFGDKDNVVTANDGMDIAICSLAREEKNWILKFSGANHTAIIVRKNEVVQTAYDRTGISFLTPQNYNYTETSYPLFKDDMFYLFSDGYADQFGGPRGKKFKYSHN